ncbi:erythroblast NAD(P)(+)--arginine ADP-ribosyltransferase-like [Epinephelus lanceolatus]
MAAVTFWAAVLLTYGVSTGIAMVPSGSSQGQGRYAKASRGSSKVPSRYQKASRASSPVASGSSNIPSASWQAPSGAGPSAGASAGADDILKLDMAPNSVDDMYQGCKREMYQNLQELLANEKNKNPTFKGAWESSEQRYNNKFKKSKPALGKDRIVAIYYYTFGGDNAYLDFNNAVRTQGPQYKTTFGYHALHFLLTDAIQTLKERRLSNLAPGDDGCVTGYRRVDKTFDQVVNTQLRFGSFTSSSMGQYSKKVERFGDKTCFEIYTCFGVDISMYSKFENEGEVLIPPYEVFKVVGVKKRSQYKDLPCEVEYKLRSTKTFVSNLNCALIKK